MRVAGDACIGVYVCVLVSREMGEDARPDEIRAKRRACWLTFMSDFGQGGAARAHYLYLLKYIVVKAIVLLCTHRLRA